MRHPRERGMATAEYTVGTLGAVLLASILFKLGLDDGWFFDQLSDIIKRALSPRVFFDLMKNLPVTPFGHR